MNRLETGVREQRLHEGHGARETEGEPSTMVKPGLCPVESPQTVLTVCTYPGKFGRMFEVLKRNGWVVVKELGEGKVLMKCVV
jgi:hypothetical protein